jgi:hypothetical protein
LEVWSSPPEMLTTLARRVLLGIMERERILMKRIHRMILMTKPLTKRTDTIASLRSTMAKSMKRLSRTQSMGTI